MALLDREYFDSISIEIAKKKYYNANKVEAVFADIRKQAEELNAENESLRRKLEEATNGREEIGTTILSAKSISQMMIREADEKAETIVAEAKKQAEELLEQAEKRAGSLRLQAEQSLAEIRAAHEESLAAIDAALREIDGPAAPIEESVPQDLNDKIAALADALFSLDSPEFEKTAANNNEADA